MRLPESDRSVMEAFWERGPMTAKEAAKLLGERLGWSKTTTYTMLTRCVNKGYLSRSELHFLCTPVLTKEQVSRMETEDLLQHNYNGSADLLVAALVDRKLLSAKEIKKLYEYLQQMEEA